MNNEHLLQELHFFKQKQITSVIFLVILTSISGISIFWNFIYGSVFDTSAHILVLAGAWTWTIWEYSEMDNRIEQIYLTLCKNNKT